MMSAVRSLLCPRGMRVPKKNILCVSFLLPPTPTSATNFIPSSPRFSSSSFSSSSSSNSSSPPPKSMVYTRKGDTGLTYLFNMERLSKTEPFFDALGNVDEANSTIAIASEHCLQAKNGLDMTLTEIQSRLLDIGSSVATPLSRSSAKQLASVAFAAEEVEQLEAWINELDAQLPPLTNFIIPGGGHASAALHVARSVVRRAERSVVPLVQANECDPVALRYLNRLSDYLFVAARFAAQHEGKPERMYQKSKA